MSHITSTFVDSAETDLLGAHSTSEGGVALLEEGDESMALELLTLADGAGVVAPFLVKDEEEEEDEEWVDDDDEDDWVDDDEDELVEDDEFEEDDEFDDEEEDEEDFDEEEEL